MSDIPLSTIPPRESTGPGAWLRSVVAIGIRDGLGFFRRPQGFAFLAVFSLIAGFFFYHQMVTFSTICSHAGPSPAIRRQISVNEQVIGSFIMDICIMLMIMVPVITTRSFAEEEEEGTASLLLTSPVGPWAITLGKFLGSLIPVWSLVLLITPHILSVFLLGEPETLPVISGLGSLLLLTAVMAALGNMASALARSRIISMALALGFFLVFWIMGWSDGYSQGAASILIQLSTSLRVRAMTAGMVTLSDLLFFPSLVLASLALTVSLLRLRRWRD